MSVTTSLKKIALCALIVPTLLGTPVMAGNASNFSGQPRWNANAAFAGQGQNNRSRIIQNRPVGKSFVSREQRAARASRQNSVSVIQNGNGNAVTVTQTGVNNSVNVVQVGQGYSVNAIQGGSGNVLVIYQQ